MPVRMIFAVAWQVHLYLSFTSGERQGMAYSQRSLHVSFSGFIDLLFSTKLHKSILIHSWEFVTTLEYEWSIIRGRRPYRWTIWVRCLPTTQAPRADFLL
jgi:hypothetical protein